MNRRLLGMLRTRLPEAGLDEICDPRKDRGKRWSLVTLLRTVVIGLAAGCKSLLDLEQLTESLSAVARKQLGIARRVPDTTLRALCCRLNPAELRKAIHAMIRAAHRRKALEPEDLPFGVVAMDGKATALTGHDELTQRRTVDEEGKPLGLLRTITCSLVSSQAKVVIDTIAQGMRAEAAVFPWAFFELLRVYGKLDLFRLISYDAGGCSRENADLVHEHGYYYLFALKSPQKMLYPEAQRLLGGLAAEHAVAVTDDLLGGRIRVVRRLYISEELKGFHWSHLATVVRVESETIDAQGRRTVYENRYFASNLALKKLTPPQWLRAVRLHWVVENNCHGTLDTAFAEDDHPWIESNPQGALVVALLRRLALNLLALFRSVTQRASERRAIAWKSLMRALALMLMTLSPTDAHGIRARLPAAPA
jgi:hypothetical protein